MKNEANNNICEITQLSISDKLDSAIALDYSEKQHLEGCSDCQQFYHFIHGDSLQQIAHTPAHETFDIEEVYQAATIMEMLTQEEQVTVKKSNVLRFSLVTAAAAAAAIAAVSISKVIQPPDTVSDSEAIAQTEVPNKNKITLPTLSIPEINLDEKYSAINSIVVNRISSVSHGVTKLKACFVEGNAFLDEYTRSEPVGPPESYYSIQTDIDSLG